MVSKEEVADYLRDVTELLDVVDETDIMGLSPVVFKVVLEKCKKNVHDATVNVVEFAGKWGIAHGDIVELGGKIQGAIKEIMETVSRVPYGQSLAVYLLDERKRRERELFRRLLSSEGLEGMLEEFLLQLSRTMIILKRKRDESIGFSGRKGVKEYVKLSDDIQILEELRQDIANCSGQIEYLYNKLFYAFSTESESMRRLALIDDILGKFQVAQQLSIRVSHRLFSAKMLDILTGLSSITARPSFEQIEFRLIGISGNDEPSYLSMDELFFRYPPYEPISAKLPTSISRKGVKVAGSRIWFIDCENVIFKKNIFFDRDIVYKGETKEGAGKLFLESVEPVDVLTRKGYASVTFYLPKRGRIFLKYGSERLRNTIWECSKGKYRKDDIEECVKEKYREFLKSHGRYSSKKTSYNPLNLSYVWYCGRGKGLSTDPWDIKCPFERWCEYARGGGYRGREHCPRWSRSRRIFPKVFPQINVEVYVSDTEDSAGIGTFRFFTARHAYVVENYVGLQWRMPAYIGDGVPMSVSFKKPIVKELPDTNIVGLEFPFELISGLSDMILDGSIEVPRVNLGYSRNIGLSDLLVSKFFLWDRTERGLASYEYLRNSTGKILEEYREFRKKLKDEEEIREKFRVFIARVLAHTLAHLLLSYLTSSLDLEFDDLIYSYKVDVEKGSVEVYVAENSPFGNLDLPGQIMEYFGSMADMASGFLREVTAMLSSHRRDIVKSLDMNRSIEESFLAKNNGMRALLEKLRELYGKIIDSGLVLDQWYFGLHLLLSDKLREYAGGIGVEEDEAFQHFDELVPLAGPPSCLDGCNECVMFEKRCREALGQHLSVSRHLVEVFLGFFFGGREFRGIGGKLGPWLLSSLPRRRLVAISPFINGAGVKLLQRLASKGIDVSLITRRDMLDRIPGEIGFGVAVQGRPSHEKIYIVDGELVITSSWNLIVGSRSWENFTLKWDREEAKRLEEVYLGGAEWVR